MRFLLLASLIVSFFLLGVPVDSVQTKNSTALVKKIQKNTTQTKKKKSAPLPQKQKLPQQKKTILPACKPSGCNGEICSDTPLMSPCWVLPEFACYKGAECTRLKNGQCGWVETKKLTQCLAAKHIPGSLPESIIPKPLAPMKISSSAFEHNTSIPAKYTCDGSNTNPPLTFADIPSGTKSLVLLMDDPDVPKSIRPDGMWDHWVVWNIPPTATSIEEGKAPDGVQGKNSGGSSTYYSPCPPDREHRYFFKLYALDTMLDLPASSTKAQVEKAMEGHVLQKAELLGRYNRT